MKKYIFINDTSTQKNWGCHSTSYHFEEFFKTINVHCGGKILLKDLLKSETHLRNVINQLDLNDVDFVIINGEGSFYDSQKKGLNTLSCINLIKSINNNIKFLILNSTYDLSHQLMRNKIIEVKDSVSLFSARETVSHKTLLDLNIKNCILQPDFLYQKIQNHTANNYIVIGGNSNYYRGDRPAYNAVGAYIELIQEIQKISDLQIKLYASGDEEVHWMSKLPYELITVHNTNWREAFNILSSAKLSISGRYHPSIMSLCGKTPSYFISANNCKMKGTCDLIYNNLNNFTSSHSLHKDIPKIVKWVDDCSKSYSLQVDRVDRGLNRCLSLLENSQRLIKSMLS